MKKLIVIAGPTASGKTDLAIELAQKYNTEILSADSRQCYTELNIGVAKPSVEQLALVKHHFINSHSIHDHVTAGDFERYGLDILATIFQKNDIAICVGGTGLYIKALCEGIDEMPMVDEIIKKEIEEKYKQNGLSWLQNEIEKEDNLFAKNGEMENPFRILRALIFKLSTGKSILTFRNNTIKKRDFTIEKYCIDIEKELLYNRINDRVDTMIADGLVEEVQNLVDVKNLKNLQTVGYSELFDFFDNRYTYLQAVEKIKQHTRNYAKRQVTWFKHQGNFSFKNSDEIAKLRC